MEKTLVIIDGNSLINRAYFAMQHPMITKDGVYTQGIYGFLNMLQKIKDTYEPGYMAVTFDLKAPTFRHLEYSEYKAGRKGMPDELAMEMPILKEILDAMNIARFELEGYEADDLIGTISRLGEEMSLEPLIVTGDKDALQLCSDITRVLITKRGVTDFEVYDTEKMLERYEMTPLQFIDLKGIMGDSSDNIPGIQGIGEKGGIELIKQFGSIENMIANTEEIKKPAMRNKVEEGATLALMSKKLATINRFVPVEIDFDKLRFVEPDYEQLIELYRKLEFNSFLNRLDLKDTNETLEIAIPKLNIVRNVDNLDSLDLFKEKEVVIKVFTDNNHVETPTVEGIALISDSDAIYLDGSKDISEVINKLNSLNLKLLGHDLKNDIYALCYNGYSNFEVLYDTQIAEYVIDPTRGKYFLKVLCLDKLNKNMPDLGEVLGETQIDLFTDNSKMYLDYALKYKAAIYELKKVQEKELIDNKLEEVFKTVELPLIKVLTEMEVSGVNCDKGFLEEFGERLVVESAKVEEKIYDLAGEKFNVKSPTQLGPILFEKLGLPAGKKTKKGYSTSAEILEKIKDKHEIVPLILEYRNLTKLESTYVSGMKSLISSDSKIHAHFQQTITQTGRLSCTEPNLQNIPVRQDLGRMIRKAFYAREGYTLVGADYSQIELRVLAHLSQDEGLIDAFNKGEDIHKMTASRVLGIPFDEVTSLERSKAKAVNFGVIYGMSSFGLSEEIKVSRKEAEDYISEYFEKHPKVKKYMDDQIKYARELGYSETILGRKRKILELKASNFMERQLGERLAMNTPIQGSAADIIKLAMIKVNDRLKKDFPDAKLVLQVHDELIIEAPISDSEKISEMLQEEMKNAIDLSVSLETEVNVSKSWYDLK